MKSRRDSYNNNININNMDIDDEQLKMNLEEFLIISDKVQLSYVQAVFWKMDLEMHLPENMNQYFALTEAH